MDYLLHHLFMNSSRRVPEKVAIADSTRNLTYRQVEETAGGISEWLAQAGIRKGDRVAFYLDHDVYQALVIIGISASGAVFVPVNSLLYPQQVQHILCDSETRYLLTTRALYSKIESIHKDCPTVQTVCFVEELSCLGELKRNTDSIENDLAAILYTSGSSGRPKGVMLSHKNLIAGCWIVSEYLELTEKDRLLGILPLSFDYGLNQLITMLAQGGFYQFHTFVVPNQIVDALSRYEITGLAGIPTIWALLVRSTLAKTKLPHLRYITNSGGAVPLKVLTFLRNALPSKRIYLMYGLTEAFRSTYLSPEQLDQRPTSMGKAIPNTEIMVLDENGEICGDNQIGQLVHRGPTVSLGYWKRPEENQKRFRYLPLTVGDQATERVVFSGDLVKRDEEGYLYFMGRNDSMIKCSGNRISPGEVEEVLFATGLLLEAAAIGIPDEVAGQVIKVFIVPKEQTNNQEALSQSVLDYCAQHMPSFMIPRHVQVVVALPKTSNGKVDYPSLKKDYHG
jgi:acyl-CoA ligase (AMP-forming) (exosortase A-associated)